MLNPWCHRIYSVTSLVRESERLESDVGTDVNIYDEAETANENVNRVSRRRETFTNRK